jgi:thioredoxin 1
MVKELNTFSELVSAVNISGGVVIDFSTPWCGPCRVIAPKFDALSLRYPTVKFYSVNIDAAEEIAQQLQITSVPTFMFFNSGKHVSSVSGANIAKITEEVIKLLQPSGYN